MADGITVTVDTRGFDLLAQQYEAAGKAAMIRLLEYGEEAIREEAPERTGRLKGKRSAGGSVSSEYKQTATGYAGEINVSAIREPQSAQTATVHYPSGKTKQVKTRPQPAFDYAEVVATGRPRLSAPKNAKAFLVPVIGFSLLKSETYVVINGQQYLYSRSLRARKPNDYPGRALQRLSAVAEGIVLQALQDVVNE